jgi:hypothetical protein
MSEMPVFGFGSGNLAQDGKSAKSKIVTVFCRISQAGAKPGESRGKAGGKPEFRLLDSAAPAPLYGPPPTTGVLGF